MCYTCVRECPSKSIRITEGQAQIVPSRCIACGNCVRVCSQNAKTVVSTIEPVQDLLRSGVSVAACIAPSFPAEFSDFSTGQLVSMIHKLGFKWVNEVGFGADIVAHRYREVLTNSDERYIATSCPAIVTYVERYMPELIPHLSPIVSPMVAEARILRKLHGERIKVVFIGPCIAKKNEGSDPIMDDDIDAVITFAELRKMFRDAELDPETVEESDFDGPRAGIGAIFPISKGMLQAADIDEDLLSSEVVAADGRNDFVEALREFQEGTMEARLLEILACKGCIMGAGMTTTEPLFRRRNRISKHVRENLSKADEEEWKENLKRFADVDLTRKYRKDDQRIAPPSETDLDEILERMGKHNPEDHLNCGACGYETCMEHAIAVYKGLAETEMCLPNTIEQLRATVQELSTTQEALMQSEKMASMGQLAAGIAHEVNNPLGVVLMYAHLLMENAEGNEEMKGDIKLIVEQADRCKKIVAGLLHFARQNKVLREETDIRDLMRRSALACTIPNNVDLQMRHVDGAFIAELDGDQVIQVLTNLITNACAAMPEGGTLTLETSGDDDNVYCVVKDTGTGISPDNRKKIFEPFFTTKPIGKGTGLGLSVSYGIVKMHRGDISLETNHNPAEGPTGSTFKVKLPRKGAIEQL